MQYNYISRKSCPIYCSYVIQALILKIMDQILLCFLFVFFFFLLIYEVTTVTQSGCTFTWLNSDFVPLSFNEKFSENTCQWGMLGKPSFWVIVSQKTKYWVSALQFEMYMEGKTVASSQFYMPLMLNSGNPYFTLIDVHLQKISR